MPIVQIELLEMKGRDVEKKRRLAEKVTEAMVEALGDCTPESIRIIIRDMKLENYSRGGKLAVDW